MTTLQIYLANQSDIIRNSMIGGVCVGLMFCIFMLPMILGDGMAINFKRPWWSFIPFITTAFCSIALALWPTNETWASMFNK